MREWGGKYLCAAFVALTMLMTGFFTGMASAGALDRINQEKAIRIAYREDAPPFSYKDKIGEPVGFMIDLCREVAKKLADQLQLASLNVVLFRSPPPTASRRSGNRRRICCASRRALLCPGARSSIFRFRPSSTAPA
jgi:ABC-type amino acid transport substrate-binding protein